MGAAVVIDPKPRRRIIEDQLGWDQLRRTKLYPCRTCGATFLPQLHHLVPRSQGGDDIPDNLVPLCSDCHGKVENWDLGARALLRETLGIAEVAYIVERKSAVWLDHAYPSATTYCAERHRVVRVIAGICEGCGERVEARSFVSEP